MTHTSGGEKLNYYELLLEIDGSKVTMTSPLHDSKGVKMSVRSKEIVGYVGVKCKQKGANGRLSRCEWEAK